jgi:hypothetical protein
MGILLAGHEHGEMTLVFTLSATRELAAPAAAIEDAREWSRYVGVVDRSPAAVRSFAEEHDIEPDAELDEGDKWQTAQRIRVTTDAPRHVLVGVTDGDRTLAMHLDWEYKDVAEAARDAGWQLERDAGAGDGDGLLARLGSLLPFGSEE